MPFDFSALKPRREPVVGPDGGAYEVRSASADATIKFRAATLGAQRLEDGKLVRLESGYVESELVLVSNCLFRAGTDQLVGAALLRGWDGAVMKRLYEWVLDNSPGVVTRTREGLEEERARIDRLLAGLDKDKEATDPKGSSAS